MPTIPYVNSKGDRIPGVTTINGNLGWSTTPLMIWAWKQGYDQCKDKRPYKYNDVADKAAEAGTIAHALIEADIKGIFYDTSECDPELLSLAETAYLNFLQWKENYKFEAIETEPHLISEVYQFGGTPDMIARINGKPALFDWKSGSGIYEDYLIQISAYKVLWEENHPDILLDGGFHLLRIDKESATFTHKYWHNLDRAWEAFLHLLELHTLHKELKRLAK